MTNERTNERLEEVSSHSLDITEQNIEKLKELFPEVLTEKKIDFDKLRLILGDEVETAPERYSFTWNGKKQAMQLAQQPTVATLKPNKAKSKNWDETQNLYIEGDNLEVLKILQKSYANKVKLIYLDPPYNTGHDFVYQDNFHDTIKNYLEETGQVDSDGHKYSHNSETSGRFHTDWLDMIYSRLKLGRNLLTDDGAIFVSIDDNEVDNLRKIMDEIFGEKNFLAMITVIVRPEGRHYGAFSKTHDFLLVYAKNADEVELNEIQPSGSEFKYTDEFGGFNLRDLRNQAPRLFNSRNRPNLRFPLWVNEGELNDNGFMPVSTVELDGWTEVWPIVVNGNESVYQWGRDKIANEINDVTARKGTDGVIRIYQKRRKITQKAKTLWTGAEFISNRGTKETQALFDGKTYFDFPKPVELIKRIAEISTNEDDIILDAFSGSGTTAEAVMRMNVEDGGNRRFIMVQLPEQLSEKDVAFKDGYKTIPEIAEERICRAGDKIVEENPLLADKLDIGFKVFELSKSNIKKWNAEPKDLNEQFELLANNFEEGSKSIDVVYEIMLKQGLDLTYPISEIKVGDAIVYDIAFGAMFVVLGDKITSEVAGHIMKQIADEEAENSVVVLQDEKFINDSEKLNTIEQLNASGIQYNDILSI
ncbi:site-specific DNA-methyltransferase [Pediococcus pentosaceus]|uniref:site-specific DNA-methyltransferase n=1 Tax=Pediococcus pentosaceus TaxID=1255 RepID=UPI002B4BEE8D|nr:site-specific DNA-methyltransferase [Pediococcus pentosaceus]MEB3376424.1 site-specific DNA-methyltransferase [Pediococcus pentosaceus]